MKKVHKIFLSYNSLEKDLAKKITRAFEESPSGMAQVFYAPNSIRMGSFWQQKLATEIAEADVFILLITEKGIGTWQVSEYYEAYDLSVNTGRPIVIPVLKEGQNAPGLPFLNQLQWIVDPKPESEECIGRILDCLNKKDRDVQLHQWKHTRPYQGLLSMGESDSEFFYGRIAETERIIKSLENSQDKLPILIGNSGVGKSSIAKAGVISCFKKQSWPETSHKKKWPDVFENSRSWVYLTIRPGRFPLKALLEGFWQLWELNELDPDRESLQNKWIERLLDDSASLKGLMDATQDRRRSLNLEVPERFLIYMDQGEELFTRAEPMHAKSFSKILTKGLEDERLLCFASMRSDFYGHLQADENIVSCWKRIDVRPLQMEKLIQVIKRPAENLGVEFLDPDLPDELARQTISHSSYLPLLSYLLDEMWSQMQKRGDGKMIPGRDAVNVGSALANSGDRFINENGEKEESLRKIITLRLVHLDETGHLLRRRAYKSELSESEWQLVSHLANYPWRLLVTGQEETEGAEPFVEVGHEALFSEWKKLQNWLTGNKGYRNFLIWKTSLERMRVRYEQLEGDNKSQALLQGYDLSQAKIWRNTNEGDIPEEDLKFVDKSIQVDSIRRIKKSRARKTIVWVGLIALVSMSVLAIYALGQRKMAFSQLQSSRATESKFLSDLAFRKQSEGKIGEALSLAASAVPIDVSGWPIVKEAENALFSTLHNYANNSIRLKMTLAGHEGTVREAMYTSDDRQIVTRSYDGTLRVWDAEDGVELAVFAHDLLITGMLLSDDNERLISWSPDSTARIWNLTTLEETHQFKHNGEVKGAKFIENDRLVTWATDSTVKVWNLSSNKEITEFRHEGRVIGLQLTKDQRKALSWSFGGEMTLWDLSSGQPQITMKHNEMIFNASLVLDESKILSHSADGTAVLWDTSDGSISFKMGHENDVRGVSFSNDSSKIMTWSEDGTTKLWDLQKNLLIHEYVHINPKGEGNIGVLNASFSKDDKLILTRTSNYCTVWDSETGKRIAQVNHKDYIIGAIFSPDEEYILSYASDGEVILWSIKENKEQVRLNNDYPVYWAIMSSNSYWIWTFSEDGTIKITSKYGQLNNTMRHDGKVLDYDNSVGGSFMTTSLDGTAKIWEFNNSARYTSIQHNSQVSDVITSPNNKYLLSWANDSSAILWDIEGADTLQVISSLDQIIGGAFVDKEVVVWDKGGHITIFNIGDGNIQSEYDHGPGIKGLIFKQSNSYLYSWSADGKLMAFNLNQKRQKNTIELSKKIEGITISDDYFISWSYNDGIWVHNLEGKENAYLKQDQVKEIKHLHSNKVLIITDIGTAKLWDVNQNTILADFRHQSRILDVQISKEHDKLLTYSIDGTARLWDIQTGDELIRMKHNDVVRSASFSNDETKILTMSDDATVRVWDSKTGNELVRIFSRASFASFSFDDSRLITSTRMPASINFWDAATGGLLTTFSTNNHYRFKLLSNGSQLITWTKNNKEIFIWPIWWKPSDMVSKAQPISNRLRSLSKIDRCAANLDTTDCYLIKGFSESDLAMRNDKTRAGSALVGVGTLADFAVGTSVGKPLDIEIAASSSGKCVIFHNLPMPEIVSVEYYRDKQRIAFVKKNGQIRDLGMNLAGILGRYLREGKYILMIHVDTKTMEYINEPRAIPLDIY